MIEWGYMTAATFTRTKVGSMTLGERFRKIRSDRRISLSEVSRATKIRVKYLEAIEEGAYDRLPAEVYVKGFLRSYAGYLGVPEDAILKLYERERHICRNLGQTESARPNPLSPDRLPFSLSPRMLTVGVGIIVAIAFFAYLSLELRSFVSEPRLSISSPSDGETVDAAEILVSGRTDPRAKVRINDDDAVVDEDGAFSERVTLTAGLNVITVSSENRFGKVKERTISVNVPSPSLQPVPGVVDRASTVSTESVRILLRTEQAVVLSVVADGETVWSGEMPVGEEHSFTALGRIEVSADVGDAVSVQFAEEAEEPLSEGDGGVTVVFGPEGRMTGEESPPGMTEEEDGGDGSNTE